jgi:hypothetical protein
MSTAAIDQVIAAQSALIDALDGGRVEAVEAATQALVVALAALRGEGAARASSGTAARVDHALRQTGAASVRVNYLTDRTRQRLDRIALAQGRPGAQTYDSSGKPRLSGARR